MTTTFIDPGKIIANSIKKIQGGLLLNGRCVSLELPEAAKRYLYSGWQSWSLTAWVDVSRSVRPMRPSSLRPMQTDPAYARETRPNGSWYGAVEFEHGQVLFLGALGLESHVRMDGMQTLTGWYEAGEGEWFVAWGEESEIFEEYAMLLKERFGAGRTQKALRVWCSWYSLYSGITEERLLKVLHNLGDLSFDVSQVDDGWQTTLGDWEPNAKFPSGMNGLATQIRATGRKAGLWLAPLLVVPSSRLWRDHKDWLLHDKDGRLVPAGFNWGERLYALDTTHPEALDWLRTLMEKVRGWGYEYVKLDFLYAGALPGQRCKDMPREAAFRNGLQVLREALGQSYLLSCGAPILPSLGLCDGLRVGPDVAAYWSSHRDDALLMNTTTPGACNAIRTTINRLWLRPLVNTDPDVVYFRTMQNDLSEEQKQLLQDLAQITDFKATSDPPTWLTDVERAALGEFLDRRASVRKTSRTTYELDGRSVDFSAQTGMPPLSGPITNLMGAVIGGLANVPFLMKFFDLAELRTHKKKLEKYPV